jgi:hypothetical protein
MSGTQQPTSTLSGGVRDRLEQAIAAASASGEEESDAVCRAVEDAVIEAKSAGAPPERVLVTLKGLAIRVLDTLRLPLDRARAALAWIVRCAVKAYYRDA